MSPTVPAEFIPDGQVFLGLACPHCGEPLSTHDDSRGPVIYNEAGSGEHMLDVLELETQPIHLACAFAASSTMEKATPRTCPDCGRETRWKPAGASGGYRICPRCPASTKDTAEVER